MFWKTKKVEIDEDGVKGWVRIIPFNWLPFGQMLDIAQVFEGASDPEVQALEQKPIEEQTAEERRRLSQFSMDLFHKFKPFLPTIVASWDITLDLGEGESTRLAPDKPMNPTNAERDSFANSIPMQVFMQLFNSLTDAVKQAEEEGGSIPLPNGSS